MKPLIANRALSDFYSKIHTRRGYYDSVWKNDARKTLISKILCELKKGSEVLDLGCRDGAFSIGLLDSFRVTGVDIDPYAVLQYKERLKNNPNASAIVTDLNQTFPFEDMRFDAIIAGEIIEHLINPNLFLQEIKRVLKSDGIFVGSTPNAARFDKRLQLLMGKDPKEFSDPTHLQYFTKYTLETLLHGEFSDVKLRSYRNSNIIKILPSVLADGFVFACRL